MYPYYAKWIRNHRDLPLKLNQWNAEFTCGLYYRPRLGFTVNPNASCPFASDACLFSNLSAFSMDSGLIDSHSDLGINARPEHRIKFRRVTTCTPILYTQWAWQVNTTDFDIVLYINAGAYLGLNWTFQYRPRFSFDNLAYSLSVVYFQPDLSTLNGQWNPDPMLKGADADVTLMMLNQNRVMYKAPSDDPWMPAHNKDNSSTEPIWLRDYGANLMGCIDQYQICNPNKANHSSAYTKLLGQITLADKLVSLAKNTTVFNDHQLLTAIRTLGNPAISIWGAVLGRGASALNANEQLDQGVQDALPSTQWQTELSIWFSIGLAKLQSSAVEWATAPKNIKLEPDSTFVAAKADSPIQREMCRNQLVHEIGSYQSFSILGIALIIAIGGVLIVLGTLIDTFIGRLRLGHKTEYCRNQWILEGKLQLQRAAYEGLGFGIWREKLEVVPTTIDDDLAMLPSSDVFLRDTRRDMRGEDKDS